MNNRAWCLTVAVTLAGVSPAVAQVMVPDIGGRVFGTVGGSFGDGGSTVMTSGGVGLRLTRHLGLDLELLYVPGLEMSDDDRFFIQEVRPFGSLFAPTFVVDRDAAVTAFLTKFTVEFPVAGGRLFPYLTGGGGVGHVSERIRYRLVDSPFPTLLEEAPDSVVVRRGAAAWASAGDRPQERFSPACKPIPVRTGGLGVGGEPRRSNGVLTGFFAGEAPRGARLPGLTIHRAGRWASTATRSAPRAAAGGWRLG